jgi:hypothetical protein
MRAVVSHRVFAWSRSLFPISYRQSNLSITIAQTSLSSQLSRNWCLFKTLHRKSSSTKLSCKCVDAIVLEAKESRFGYEPRLTPVYSKHLHLGQRRRIHFTRRDSLVVAHSTTKLYKIFIRLTKATVSLARFRPTWYIVESTPLRAIHERRPNRMDVMLRLYHGRSGYSRIDDMSDLERRLVRKLGTSRELGTSSSRP